MQEKGLEELVLPKDLLATVTVRCDFISNLDTTKELVLQAAEQDLQQIK